MKPKSGALQPLIAELDAVIAAAQAAGLQETVSLLRIARLDLIMRANDIAVDELELVAFVAALGLPAAPRKPRRRKKKPDIN